MITIAVNEIISATHLGTAQPIQHEHIIECGSYTVDTRGHLHVQGRVRSSSEAETSESHRSRTIALFQFWSSVRILEDSPQTTALGELRRWVEDYSEAWTAKYGLASPAPALDGVIAKIKELQNQAMVVGSPLNGPETEETAS